MAHLQHYFRHVMNSLQHHRMCSDLTVRGWSQLASELCADEELLDLLTNHSVCFDNPSTIPYIRLCLDYTVSECLGAKVMITPFRG